MEIKNIFKQTNSMWVKYSDYQIRAAGNVEYILPTAGATFSVYDSVENTAELVADALQTGQIISDNENNNDEIKKAALSFTRKHGLLGWMMALPLEKTFDDQKQVYLGRNGALLKKPTMPTDKYYDLFLGASETPRDEHVFPPLIAYTVNREAEYEKAFSAHYGEPLLWTAAWLMNLYHHFFSCKNHDNADFTNDERVVMRKKVSSFEHSGITFNIENGRTGLGHGSKLDAEVSAEFIQNWNSLVFEANEIKKRFDLPFHQFPSITTEEIIPTGCDKFQIQKVRIGQSFFRKTLLSTYGGRCCITDIGVADLLRASHIKPWGKSDINEKTNPCNGLLLNALFDTAFDKGYMTIDNEYRVVVSRRIREYSDNKTKEIFERYNRKHINLPSRFLPDTKFIEFHNDIIFLKS